MDLQQLRQRQRRALLLRLAQHGDHFAEEGAIVGVEHAQGVHVLVPVVRHCAGPKPRLGC
jgi:hypothetical protein